MHTPIAAAASGLLSGAAALGAAELAAALLRPQASPLLAVGSAFIDLTPEWLKAFAIRTFGADDKTVLMLGLVAAVAACAIAAGLLSTRRPRLAAGGVATLAALTAVAALSRPGAAPADALPSLVAAVTGTLALHLMRRPRPPHRDLPAAAEPARAGRRALLRAGVAVLGFAAVSGGTARLVNGARDAAAGGDLALPLPADPARPLPPGSDLRLPGLSSFTTSNRSFYRVDTALVVPRVPYRDWRLRVHGLVHRPVELTFDQLLSRPLVERDITLTCVSNEVGGPYTGHARWLGVDLAQLLREAGVRPGADQILSRSADGWTCGTPVETVLDGRDALLAVGMNGEVLPAAHGFPARMIVPGLYGYVSATKWVTEIKITRFADEQAYWTRRGWAEIAPIKTASRIEVPKPFARIPAGRTTIAGTAWAQHRGVAAVEVRIDQGPWTRARLAPSPTPDTWRQWHLDWPATPGDHHLEVRAIDATGQVQPSRRTPPFPDGTTGRHSVLVTVS
ncbi:sulfite oxidase [Planotetraspora kaengkrachanensis]|uniref:Oxidoreductase n=1 Tax=Planotetraspora kaengkrachanensis TaxID=575193 RepID=A0A8J3PX58_9ACTN|nr:oxidoreductase [Planotetraspora kaengkrachanensis]